MAGKNPSWRSPDDSGREPPARKRASWREMTQSVLGMGGGGQRWRAEPRPKATGRHARQARIRLFKKLAATFAALAVIGVGLALEFRVWGTTPVITYYAVDYEAPLPPNAWAYEDCEALQEAGARSFLNPLAMTSPPTAALNTKPEAIHDAWLASLREAVAAAAKRDSHDLVVIYLSMHGVVNDGVAGKPQPCLLLPDATRKGAAWADTKYWLPLAKVLGALEEEAVKQETHVLLALDANRIDAVWELGILQNDFAKVARDEVQSGERPHLSVLNSTGVGQLAWSFPELGRSLFGYYFDNGLRGAADADGDKQVELQELRAYVESNVDRRVRGQLGEEVRQTPELWQSKGKEDDRVVASCVPNYQPPEPTALAVDRRDVAKALEVFQTAFANPSENGFRRARPLAWESRRRDLWRVEQLQAAGQAYAGAVKDPAFAKIESARALLNRAKAWSYGTEAAESPLANLELSLSWATRFSPKALALLTNEQFASYSKQLSDIAAGPTAPVAATAPAAPADAAASAQENSGSAASAAAPADPASAKEERKLKEEPSVAIKTAVAWRWFCDGQRTKAGVERVLDTLLPTKSAGGDATLAELQWMRLLLRDFDEQLWERNSALVMSLGQVRDASEQAATMLAQLDADRGAAQPLNLGAFGVLSQRLEAIERRRRDFEDQALIGAPNQAAGLRETADKLVKEYAALRNLAAKLDSAQSFWDEAVAESPSLLSWQVRRTRYGAALLLKADETRKFFGQLEQLANMFDSPEQLFSGASSAPADGSDFAVALKNVESAVLEPRRTYNELKGEYKRELSEVDRIGERINAIDLRRAEILLAGPTPGFGNRGQLLAQRDRLAKSLFHRTADAKPAPKEKAIHVEPLQALAAWALTSTADNGASPVASGGAIRERLASSLSLTSELKSAWQEGDSIRQSTALRAIDQESRRLAMLTTYSFGEGAVPEPSAERGWLREMTFAEWQGQRLLDDFWGDAAESLANAGDSCLLYTSDAADE